MENIRRSPIFCIYILLFLILLALPLVIREPYLLHLLISMFFYSNLVTSWNIISGFAGQLSFGHAAYFGIGAYTSTLLLLNWNISPFIGMLMGGALAALFAVAVGYPCFKLRGIFYAMSTLAFSEALRLFFITWRPVTKGAEGLHVPHLSQSSLYYFQFVSKTPYYYIALLMMGVLIFVTYEIKKSKLGFYLEAIREEQDAAESLGVDSTKYKLISVAISAFGTAICGTFYAQYVLYVEPNVFVGLLFGEEIVVMGLIGGIGTVFGPIAGAFLLVPISELLRITLGARGGRYSGVHIMIYGIVLITTTMFQPQGLIVWIKKAHGYLMGNLKKPGTGGTSDASG